MTSRKKARGATLIVSLIVLTLITLFVLNAFTLSSSNLKAVGNAQARDEALAAANQALEQVVSTPFTTAPTAQEILVDINRDGTNDFTVQVDAPRCVKASQLTNPTLCEEALAALCTAADWYTDWDIKATVTDAVTGAKVVVRQGLRAKLSNTQKASACSSPSSET